MIIFDNVYKVYKNNSHALNGVSFEIKKGEFVSIVGQSGYGKSTILKMMIGEVKPTEGRVLVAGNDISKMTNRESYILRKKVGMIFQDFKSCRPFS